MRSAARSEDSSQDSDAVRQAARVPQRRRRRKKSSAFELSAPKRRHIIAWIAEAWNVLTTQTIVSDFRKAGLMNDERVRDEDFSLETQLRRVPSTPVMTQPAFTHPCCPGAAARRAS